LKQKIFFGVLIAGFLGLIVFGVWYWRHTGTQKQEDLLIQEARTEFDGVAGELTPAEAGLWSALLNAAAAQHARRQTPPEKLTQARRLPDSDHDDLRKAATPAAAPSRYAVLAELALLVVSFGGTDEQVKDQTRFGWQPAAGGQMLRVNEKTPSVHA